MGIAISTRKESPFANFFSKKDEILILTASYLIASDRSWANGKLEKAKDQTHHSS
jgi:hypothetical protein